MSSDSGKLAFEDFRRGHFGAYGPVRVTEDEIIAFGRDFDPQPMHVDAQAARATMLGEISGSGWHLCALMMRMAYDGFLKDARLANSPGVDDVRWLAPLRPGDVVRLDATVSHVRPTRSQPDVGIVVFRFTLTNGSGQTLMICDMPLMFHRRAAMPGAGEGGRA